MQRLIFATGNKNKMIEIREILKDLNLEALMLKNLKILLATYSLLTQKQKTNLLFQTKTK